MFVNILLPMWKCLSHDGHEICLYDSSTVYLIIAKASTETAKSETLT